jgi:hypothetical protein
LAVTNPAHGIQAGGYTRRGALVLPYGKQGIECGIHAHKDAANNIAFLTQRREEAKDAKRGEDNNVAILAFARFQHCRLNN